ncbi:MAG: HEPN domain-containing protein [Thermodesulfobacteria bacterium]|nr:HEPN domain-containing protein [Thermodesulfobacteriota bacterium]
MPYYIRARAYYRYAEEQLAAAEEALPQDPARALKLAREAVERAIRALWAIVQVEAPKEKPPIEKILPELEKACEPWLAREIEKAYRRIEELQENPTPEGAREAVELARFVVRRTHEVLEPIIGPQETLSKHRKRFPF